MKEYGQKDSKKENNKNRKTLWLGILALLLLLGCGTFVHNKMNQPQAYRTVIKEEMSSVYSNTGLMNDSRIEKFTSKNSKILDKVTITEIRESFSENNSTKTKNVSITIKNKTDKEISDLKMVINVLDKKGNVIENVDDNAKTIGPQSDYTFHLPIKNDKAISWELAEINE